MVAYGIGILPLIRHLKNKQPNLHQSWYADDASAAGSLQAIKLYFQELTEVGPKYGYYPEPSKSILIVRDNNLQQAQAFLDANNLGFELKTGDRYLGGYIGEDSDRDRWLNEEIADWAFGIEELATQLEEPFTILPMQAFCDKIYNWCMEIMSWAPGDSGRPQKIQKPEHQYFAAVPVPQPQQDYAQR